MKRKLSRRSFMSEAAAIAAAAYAVPAMGQAAAMPRLFVVGQGEHQYVWIDQWGRLPDEIQYGLTHGIAVDAAGNVHVLHTSRKESAKKDCVVVFDSDGGFIRSWGEQFFGGAHGFDLFTEDGREIFYITDLNKGLFKTTLDGKVLWHVENPRPEMYREKRLKYRPSNVAVAPNGDVFFADGYGSYLIHKLDKQGNYIKTFGGPGWEKGQTQHPHGIFVDTRGKEPLVIVAMNDNTGSGRPGQLQAFNLDGEHHSFLPTKVRSPRAFDRRGDLVAIPDLDAVVHLVDEKWNTVATLGDGWTTKEEVRALRTKTPEHYQAGKFICPHDAAFAADGSLFVSEWVVYGRITKLQVMPKA